MDFAFVCYRANIVFTKDDMMRFAATLKACARGEDGFARNVDGTGDLNGTLGLCTPGLWGHLGFVDNDIRSVLHGYLRKHWSKDPEAGAGMTSAAYLAETGTSFRHDQVCRKR